MKITIVYDNCQGKPGLKIGWGFSALVEVEQAPLLLFDTGDDGAALLANMEMLGIDPRQIGIIVISHDHGDHTGGLKRLLEINKNAEIYVPASFWGSLPGRKVNHVTVSSRICEKVFTTGELQGIEQSLAIETANGLVVLTGCSHPGVQAILDAASRWGEVISIVGGLHGFRDFGQMEALSRICPCHCTQYKQDLSLRYPEKYTACTAGLELNF